MKTSQLHEDTETSRLWDRIRKVEYDNEDAAAEIGRLRAALYQIETVCKDNVGENCHHWMALNFVRDVAVSALSSRDRGGQ